jgi:hypothetical protein
MARCSSQACILSTQRWTPRGLYFKSSTCKKLARLHPKEWLGRVALTCHPIYWGITNSIASCDVGQPGHNGRPNLETNQHRKTGSMVHTIEHLPSKCKALSSTHSTNKKRKERKNHHACEYTDKLQSFH